MAIPTLETSLQRASSISPEVQWYMESRGYELPGEWQHPLYKTPEPHDLEGAIFDADRVDKIMRSFSMLRHTQGRWAGKKLELDSWQIAYIIAPIFGWVYPDPDSGEYVRVFRIAMVDIPRKNGKTTTAGGIAIYLTGADGEGGAQVIAAAAGKEQANYCFSPVKALVESSPDLKLYFRAMAFKVVHNPSKSYFTAVSSIADLLHGANIHGAIVDELHVHKTRDLVDAIETGTGARQQPLVLMITTPDDGKPGTIYAEKREHLEKLARGALVDPHFYGVVWAAAESETQLAEQGIDPFTETAWRLANPGFGISPSRAFLSDEATKAKQSPASLARFLRLHLGIRTRQVTRFIKLEQWDDTAGTVDLESLAGKVCHGGLDLSSVDDTTALCLAFPNRKEDSVTCLWRIWIPEDRLRDLDRRTAGQATVWVKAGLLTTTVGNVIDNDVIIESILAAAETYQLKTLGYDRWGGTDVVRRLGEKGITCVGVAQGMASLNPPTKEAQRLILAKKLIHGGNPVMRWMTDNLSVSMDPSGNVKPDKASAADKIDGWSALVCAIKEVMENAEPDYDVWKSAW